MRWWYSLGWWGFHVLVVTILVVGDVAYEEKYQHPAWGFIWPYLAGAAFGSFVVLWWNDRGDGPKKKER